MKRMCAVLLSRQPENSIGYIASFLDAWKQAGVDTCLIAPEENMRIPFPGQRTEYCLSGTFRRAREGKYDELIVMADTLMGPVWPLSGLLSRADKCTADAWRLTAGAEMIGFRRPAWALAEAVQDVTDIFCAEPFKNAPELYDTADLIEVTTVPLLDEPLLMVRDRLCPFFPHEIFHRNYSEVISTTLGHQGQCFYRWLQRESGWNTDLLWDYLLPTCHQQDYFNNLHLTYVLPTSGADRAHAEAQLKDHSLALVMHLYYPDKLKESCAFAARFPAQTHVIITTSSEEKRAAILAAFSGLRFASLDVRVIANRGRDVSALLVGAADVFGNFDYVCFFHDKKTLQTKPGSVGAGFAHRLQENLFATPDYVLNILRLFERNPRLGMLSPPAPHHGDYFFTLGTDWGPNYLNTRQLADTLGFRAPMAPDRMPIAPLGTCFWFRGRALKPLADRHWKYEDFPPEPNSTDGTLLHAIERIYPFACVEAGYYPAYVLSDRYAAIEYSSLRYYVREFNTLCIGHGSIGYQRDMCAALEKQIKRQPQNL